MLTGLPSFNPQTKRPKCMEPGCRADADCLPKLWVPSHPLSPYKPNGDLFFTGVASVMGLPMCFPHFRKLRPRDFLVDKGVRDSIEKDFRQKLSMPWFDKAEVHYVRRAEPEFQNFIDLAKLARDTQYVADK